MPDSYHTISAPSVGEFRDRGSKFLAYAFPLVGAVWQDHLNTLKQEHPKARHHCYAYRIGLDGNNFRANDDGEPGGTAGLPILGQIDSFGLCNVLVVVVRYFGGTLLGAAGLKNAYKTAAQLALEAADICERPVENHYRIDFDYALLSRVMNAVSRLPVRVVAQDFGTEAALYIAIVQSKTEAALRTLKAQVADVYEEEVDALESIPGFELAFLEVGY